MGFHGVLLVASHAVGEYAWNEVSLEDLEERLARVACDAHGHTVWRHHVDPDYFIGHFDAASLHRRTQVSASAEHLPCESDACLLLTCNHPV